MKTVICSHGFGVRADGRGMFTDIAAAFPNARFRMFDYNDSLPNGDIVVVPLSEQASKLQHIIDKTEADEIILLAHSQGSIVAGMVDTSRLAKIILLAPPTIRSMERVIDRIAKRDGATYNPNGVSRLPRSDGTTTLLPKEYIQSLGVVHPLELYQAAAERVPTVIIRATGDTVLGMTNVDEVANATVIDLAADHDFTGDSRQVLMSALEQYLL